MSEEKKYRRHRVALLGLAALISMCAAYLVGDALTRQWRDQVEATNAADYHTKDAERRIKQNCVAGPAPRFYSCVADARNAARENQRREYELQAQRTTTIWTAVMGWMSGIAVFLSAIGVLLIFRTFQETREQGSDVRDSLQQSIRHAEAMERLAKATEINAAGLAENLRISAKLAEQQQTFGRMQMRPFLSFGTGTALYQDANITHFVAKPDIIHRGHTPAKDVRWRVAAGILPSPLPDDFRFPPLPQEAMGGLSVSQDRAVYAQAPYPVDPEEVAKIKAGNGRAFYVWGYVSYRDMFGRRYRSTFAHQYFWWGEGANERVDGMYLRRHNRSN